jgi:phospholipid-translocating ATPase
MEAAGPGTERGISSPIRSERPSVQQDTAVSLTSSDESVTESATEADSLLRDRRHTRTPVPGRRSGSLLCCVCDLFAAMGQVLCKKKQFKSRVVSVSGSAVSATAGSDKYPSNVIRNQKYNVITFLPVVLYNQFKFFLNLYFLLMSCSQFINDLKVGSLYTYWAPLGFILTVTVIREAVDDLMRYRRDKAINSQLYQKLTPATREVIPSSKIRVGDLILVYKDQRVPADMIFLKTTEKSGACFIRTDQLDGETDWKLRLAVSATQELGSDEDIFKMDACAYAEEPRKDIHSFTGTFTVNKDGSPANKLSLSIENTLWANTVVASGTAIGLVVYTGPETRSVMNNLEARSKVGLLDYEVNDITKVLFGAVVVLAFAMICLKGFNGPWYRYWFRFLLLFSYIIPISLRVNLEIGRVVYSYMIQRDIEVPGIVVRTTTIPEDLGRISYLLTDKTGTLTRNEMVFKRIHLGKVSYTPEYFDEVAVMLKQSFSPQNSQPQTQNHRRQDSSTSNISTSSDRRYFMRHARMDSYEVDRDTLYRVNAAVTALALCHNVTPSYDTELGQQPPGDSLLPGSASDSVIIPMQSRGITYQASSPDEVALVQWTEKVGLALVHRDLTSMKLQAPNGKTMRYDILQIFPFSSETKRMGIIVRDVKTRDIMFLMKGADVVMSTVIQYSDWLQEQCDNMARSGLRTLVVARKFLSEDQYNDFDARYHQAKLSIHDRASRMSAVMSTLEKDMELLCLTGEFDFLFVASVNLLTNNVS